MAQANWAIFITELLGVHCLINTNIEIPASHVAEAINKLHIGVFFSNNDRSKSKHSGMTWLESIVKLGSPAVSTVPRPL